MPLPSPRTLRRYLSVIDTKFGFDSNFFSIFEKHISSKGELQKHGIILFDEMSVRESLSVCSTSLTWHWFLCFNHYVIITPSQWLFLLQEDPFMELFLHSCY
uniref:Transposable element P transposase-like RNase H domain-containing protein n=1 Tax=Schizaphis graminum TaxID=13262 RepID=A0A2S2NCS4_SCHGA